MTVKELRDKLSKLNDAAHVVVYWEEDEEDNEQHCLGIDDVSMKTGTPQRPANKAGFTFDSKGPATWAFINVSPE